MNISITTIHSNLNKLTREEKELEEEVHRLKLKIENLSIYKGGDGDGQGKGFEYNRFLEKTTFIEFRSGYTKEIENIYRRLDELKKWIDEILELLKKFATKDELKLLEGKLVLVLKLIL